ncbi:MAG: hypothetical protein R3B72_08415 [Polyangiaceae bacterium]
MSDVSHPAPWYERALLWLTVSIAAVTTISRLSGGVQWRSDLPAVRDQGLVAVEAGGSASTMLSQALGLLPLGSMAFRQALGSALAVAVAAYLTFRIAQRLLRQRRALQPWIASLLAAIAAVMAALSPAWQREGTVGGGASVALALGLGALHLALDLGARPRLAPGFARTWLILAGLLGLTFAENVPAGLAASIAVAAVVLTAGRAPTASLVLRIAPVAVLVTAIASAGLLLRPLSPGSWGDIGRALSAASLDALDSHVGRKATLLSWLDEVGVMVLVLAAIGIGRSLFAGVASVLRRSAVKEALRDPSRAAGADALRAAAGGLIALLVVDLVYPSVAVSGLLPEPLAALRCLAWASFSIAAAVGVAELLLFLRGLRIPMARTAAVLTVAFHVTLVAVTSEDAAFAADRTDHVAAEEWTDEALARLPAHAAILVHSPELAWRLWAAQMLQGQRPDVLVVPVPMLRHGHVTNHLLPSEPAVAQLLRDLALTGEASEYGLSLLADARPLMVELDPRWDERIVSHVTVEGAWLRYAPQVLGRSDRKLAGHLLVGEGRIPSTIETAVAADTSSALVVAKTLKEHVATLSLLGMNETSRPWIDGVERMSPEDPFVVGARLRLAHAERRRRMGRRVELRDLLAF